jgi:di/tricarboxylate transporter
VGGTDDYRLADYLAELQVRKGSPLEGETWTGGPAGDEKGASLAQIIRDGKPVSRVSRTKVRDGDALLLHGSLDQIMRIKDKYDLDFPTDAEAAGNTLPSNDVRLIEALLPPDSNLVGKTVGDSNIKRRFGCAAVLAVQRRGKTIREQLARIKLDSGDSLLLRCGGDIERVLRSGDLIVTNEVTDLHLRKNRAAMALGILLAVVGAAALDLMPIMASAMVGGIAMILAGCMTIEEAYQAIDWKIIFLLGGIIPLGVAMDQSGAASWLAATALEPLVHFGPLVVLSAVYLTTAVLTETMSNNAAAVLLAPIAISLAEALAVDPRPLLVAITFAASTSFATPVGYRTNTMIYTPGGYRFLDYTLVGGPLNLVFWGIAALLIPVFWHF